MYYAYKQHPHKLQRRNDVNTVCWLKKDRMTFAPMRQWSFIMGSASITIITSDSFENAVKLQSKKLHFSKIYLYHTTPIP